MTERNLLKAQVKNRNRYYVMFAEKIIKILLQSSVKQQILPSCSRTIDLNIIWT